LTVKSITQRLIWFVWLITLLDKHICYTNGNLKRFNLYTNSWNVPGHK